MTITTKQQLGDLIKATARFTNKEHNGVIKVFLGRPFLLINDYHYVPVQSLSGTDIITNKDINAYLKGEP